MTKFVINDTSLLEQIRVDDRAQEIKELTPEMVSKVLGIKWDTCDDSFYYVSKLMPNSTKVSRRSMLIRVSSMFRTARGQGEPASQLGNSWSARSRYPHVQ